MAHDMERANGSRPPGAPNAVESLTTSLKEHSSIAGLIQTRSDVSAELAKKIRDRLSSNMPEPVQAELATLLGLLPDATGSNSLYLCEFEIAIDALLAEPPKLELARGLRMKFEEQMWHKRFGGFLLKALPATRVVFGLVLTALLLVPFLIWSTNKHFSESHPHDLDADLLVLVCCFGAFGAVTSIMVRLRSFDSIHAPPLTLFLTGFFRPFIGALFAAFGLVLVESRLLNVPDATLVYFALAIAFVAGFSERFGEDLTRIVASKADPSRSKQEGSR